MIKYLYSFCLVFLVSILSFSDQLDPIFNSDNNVVYLVKEDRFKQLQSVVYLNEEYIIYLDRKIFPNKAILKNIRTDDYKTIFEGSEIIFDRIHFHVNDPGRVLCSFVMGRLGNSPYTIWEIDLKAGVFKQIFKSDTRKFGEKLLEWNDGVAFNNEQSPQNNFMVKDTNYIKISAIMASAHNDEKDFLIIREYHSGERLSVDRLPNANEMHREFYPWPVLSSTERAFYAKLNYFDIRGGRYYYHLELFTSDLNNKIEYIKLTETNPEQNFLIYNLLSSNQNKYVIVLGKNYDEKENYIALVRKKDLAIRYFPIENMDYYRMSLKYANYTVQGDKIIISDRQEDNSFVKLVFKKKENLLIKKNYTPTVNNLRFRATPTLDGPFIRHLKAGERLELIERGQSETIGDAKGTWVKVKTAQGEVGWCFDAYLKEVK